MQKFACALIALCVAPAVARAEPDASSDGSVCWIAPKRIGPSSKRLLGEAMSAAGESTRPSYARWAVAEIPTKNTITSEVKKLRCGAVISLAMHADKKRYELRFEVTEPISDKPVATATASVDLNHPLAEDLRGAWREVWRMIARPPPPASPPPPPVAAAEPQVEKPFVDEELRTERAAEAAEKPREPALVALWLGIGVLSRSLDGAPGTPIKEAALLSLGGDATLHGGRVLGISQVHAIDLEAGYARRLATGSLGGKAVGVDADRFQATAIYRYRFGGPRGFSVGPLFGFEEVRVEIDPSAGALSARYGVLRAGVSAWQPVPMPEGLELRIRADAALRSAPGADGGDAGLDFDAGAALELELANGLSFRGRGRFAHQGATVGTGKVSDSFVDLDFSVGFAL